MGKPIVRDFTQGKGILKFFPYEGAACLVPQTMQYCIYQKNIRHCAYCGTEIAYKDMQVDHATPLRIGGADDISNYMPACRSCNHYKATLDVEGFRRYLSEIHKRLMRDSIPYQVAERFGIVKYVSDDVKFYFEELRGGE